MTPPTTIKALVVRSPYCWEIVRGEKTIEYRTWPTSHRGPLAIVAAKTDADGRAYRGFGAGCAVCVVELLECRQTSLEYEWDLGSPRAIEVVPVKGQLRLFDISIPLNFAVEFNWK